MSTTANVITGLPTGVPFVNSEMGGKVSILVSERMKPRMITSDFRGYFLGLHNEAWSLQTVNIRGVSTYYVRIEPIYSDYTDPDGLPLKGTPTNETSLGTTFSWMPYPDSYCCNGYRVYAGTTSGTLFLQGTLTGRFNTTCVINTTWTYNSSGSAYTGWQTIGPPAFAHALDVYQTEGAIDSRCFLGGGKRYSTGYAKVSTTSVAPMLTGGTSALSTVATWNAVTNGSFRVRLRWKESSLSLYGWEQEDDQDEYFDITGLNFSACTTMAEVATVIQTALRAVRMPVLFAKPTSITLSNWTSITDGSFDIYVNGTLYHITGCNFSTCTTMANVATVIQTQLAASITGATCVWDSTNNYFVIKGHATPSAATNMISNGTFDSATGWSLTNWTVSDGKLRCNSTGARTAKTTITGLGNVMYRIACDVEYTSGEAQVAIQSGGNVYTSPNYTASGRIVKNLGFPNDALTQMFFQGTGGSATVITIDNVNMIPLIACPTLSYLSRHSSGTGTDISSKIGGSETSASVKLNRRAKGATTETVAWSTDHFVLTGSDAGDQYQIGYLEAAIANVDTGTNVDISSSTYMDCRNNSTSATYRHGQTAQRTIIGYGVNWGEWAEGMAFRLSTEGTKYLIDYQRLSDCLHLDADYVGDAVLGPQEYVLMPYSNQLYISALGNPFKYSVSDIIVLPTADNDEITAIRRVGAHMLAVMNHHLWLAPSTDITNPRLISAFYGAPHTHACVGYNDGQAILTGEELIFVTSDSIKNLDAEGRIKTILARISSNAPYFHGIHMPYHGTDLLRWFVGLDDTTKYGTVINYEPRSGNFWLSNVKDANASCVVRDVNDVPYLVTGSKGSEDDSVPSFTFLHGDDYYNDGATQASGYTKQGIISSVGTASLVAPYLTCGKITAILATLQAITAGYFKIEIDGVSYKCGPCDFSGIAAVSDIAAIVQSAIRSQTGLTETVAYSTDHLVITSSTITNLSEVGYLQPYYPTYASVDISGTSYLNGWDGTGVKTAVVTRITLTLTTMAGATASLYTSNDAEKGVWVYVCDTNFKNGQYALVVSNTGNTLTVTPNFATAPASTWYWFLGGIVPRLTKWMDFGSPQHKHKIHGVTITVSPTTSSTWNKIGLQGMQDLSTTIRKVKIQSIASGQDTVNTLHLFDQPATQHGFIITRPNSECDLTIEDWTIAHRPEV